MNPAARTALTGLFALMFSLAAARSMARSDQAAAAMANAAKVFLAALDADQRSRVSFAFESPVRTDWHFVPRERRGLALGDLDARGRANFDALLDSGLSVKGHPKHEVVKAQVLAILDGGIDGVLAFDYETN